MATAGEGFTFEANRFARREPAVLELHSRGVILGRYKADRQGVVRGRATIPRRTEPGHHIRELEGRRSHLTLTTTITVTRPGNDGHVAHGRRGHSSSHHGSSASRSDQHRPSLARTASEKARALSGAAAALVAMGGGTTLAVRRRRNS
ncbi:hypothetical protein ACWGQ5_07570 [Streptomyces sp. NPDC055722]